MHDLNLSRVNIIDKLSAIIIYFKADKYPDLKFGDVSS